MKAVLIAGATLSLNGLSVALAEGTEFEIVGAETSDQAAELCVAHGITAVDFTHFDEEKGKWVTYTKTGERVESDEAPLARQTDTALTEEEAPIVEDPDEIAPDGEKAAEVVEDGEPSGNPFASSSLNESSFNERIEQHEAGEPSGAPNADPGVGAPSSEPTV